MHKYIHKQMVLTDVIINMKVLVAHTKRIAQAALDDEWHSKGVMLSICGQWLSVCNKDV